MSTHPNAILMAVLKPDDLSRKTMREILAGNDVKDSEIDNLKIGEKEYFRIIMESDYDEGYQISADEGDLVFLDMVTYGYGEVITWADLEKQKNALEEWAKAMSEKFHCSYSIQVTANYW